MRLAMLLRWQKESEFQKANRQARRAAFGQAVARLQRMSGAAVATLGKMMVDQAAPASTRVRAAECIINHAAKAIEIEDIEARISQLERAAEGHKKHLVTSSPRFSSVLVSSWSLVNAYSGVTVSVPGQLQRLCFSVQQSLPDLTAMVPGM
jgi:hypothetical protein